MKTIKILNGRIIDGGKYFSGNVVIKDGKIAYAGGENLPVPEDALVIDASGKWVSPGFIDLHTHGAGGADFMDGTPDAYRTALEMHASHGTTLLFPTTLSSTEESLHSSLKLYKEAKSQKYNGAAMGGLHLEGPYFSFGQKGAQDPRFLRNPSPAEYMALLEEADGDIARWSLAPELPGASEMAEKLHGRGVLMSMGHTDATFDECEEAFRAGFTHMTHFYSCMSTVTRRNAYRYAGVVEYGYYNDGVTVEIIGDGIHVPEALLKLIFKIKGARNIALVTDSMRAAGMPDGKYFLGSPDEGQEVIVEDGVAKLPDRSAFAGSVATMDRVVRTVSRLSGLSIPETVMSASEVPARIMGLSGVKGSIREGADADIVIFDDNVEIACTIVEGRIVYAAGTDK